MPAAARVAATVLLTFNVDDFPERDMGDVRVMTPDDYLAEALDQQTATVLGVPDQSVEPDGSGAPKPGT
jgi:hypothetical protein